MTTSASLATPTSAPLDRVRVLSRRMQWLTLCGGVPAVATAALLWFCLSDTALEIALREFLRAPLTSGTTVPLQLSLPHRVAGFLITGGALALLICVLYQAHRMLGAFARGEVFTIGTALRLRSMALALTALGPALPLVKLLLGLVLVGAPGGQTYWLIVFDLGDYFVGLLGGLLLAIAWAMVEAARIAEENKAYI